MIVGHLKKEKLKDRSLWTTDVTRLSFIIMQNVDSEKEWNNDRSGKKFTSLVITPMFKFITELLKKYLKFKKDWADTVKGNLTPMQYDTFMSSTFTANKMLVDIQIKKFDRDILRYVAPYFNFDTVRTEESLQLEKKKQKEEEKEAKSKKKVTKLVDNNDSDGEKPKKVPKKK